jgi:hypothetical protein
MTRSTQNFEEMYKFKVIDIVNATTIRVRPEWKFELDNGKEIYGDTISIAGLPADENNEWVKRRLQSFLVNQKVSPCYARLVAGTNDKVECVVYVSGTDVVYYFPEFTQKKKRNKFADFFASLFPYRASQC